MITINLDNPELILFPDSQPDCRPQQGLPVLYDQWEDVEFVYRGQSHIRKTGFSYDGMSIPNAVRSISGLEQDGPHRLADLFHDDAYQHQGKLDGWDFVLTRQECDDLHKFLCLAGGMDSKLCDTIHFFLGLFGDIAWRADANKMLLGAGRAMNPATASVHDLVQYFLANS